MEEGRRAGLSANPPEGSFPLPLLILTVTEAEPGNFRNSSTGVASPSFVYLGVMHYLESLAPLYYYLQEHGEAAPPSLGDGPSCRGRSCKSSLCCNTLCVHSSPQLSARQWQSHPQHCLAYQLDLASRSFMRGLPT